MKKSLFVLFLFIAIGADAQQVSPTQIPEYQHLYRAKLARIRKDLGVHDTLFFIVADTLAKYCVDKKFTQVQQLQNLQGVVNFLSKLEDKSLVSSGKATDMLLFAFSIIDWRKDGNLYDNISSYPSFMVRCASLLYNDSAGTKLIASIGQKHPDQILKYADQLAHIPGSRTVIEEAILEDPDFAKRYFFGDNTVSFFAETSKRKEVNDIYLLFDKYGTKSKAFLMYDALQKDHLSAHDADSISEDNKAMIKQLTHILSKPNPNGLKSTLRELDYRSTEWIRRSTEWNRTFITTQFNKFTTDQKLVILAFGYRECKPELQSFYLDLLLKGDMSSIDPNLIENLRSGPLPDFLHSLDEEKLSSMLSSFNETNTVKLTQMLASDEPKDEEPNLRIVSLLQRGAILPTPKPVAVAAPEARPVLTEKPVAKPVSVAPVPTATVTVPAKSINPKPASPAAPAAPLPKIVSAMPPRPAAPPPAAAEDMEIVEPIHIPQTDSSRAVLALKRNIFMALQDIPSFIQKNYAKDVLLYAASVEPDEVLKKVDMFKSKFWCKEVLEAATLNAPISARRYFTDKTHPVTVILGYSTDSTIKKFLKLSREAAYQSRPFLLFDEISNGHLTLADATTISRDNNALFREMMHIAAQKNYIGRYNVEREMNYYALKYIRGINDKVDLPEKERYESVENLDCNELYYLMVYGREEVFSHTFDGLFSRFRAKCVTSENWKASVFMSYPHYRSFIAMCAAYNMLDKFLALFPTVDQKSILVAFTSDLDKSRNELSDAATVAETVANTTNNSFLQIIQSTIKSSYLHRDSLNDYNGMAIYGILAAMCKDKAVSDKKWFSYTAKKYKTGALTTLTNASLMDQKVFVERMYFYDDEDGRASYKNFISSYTGSSHWTVEQNYSYAKVSSNSGNKVEIYANKAELEESGDKEIAKIISANNYSVKGIVHRGHSFHTEATLMKVSSAARFIFIGSCGGFYKIDLALRKAPDAHIISSRQVGTMEINDPIIYSFNEYVRRGSDINWKTFWDEMKGKLGSNSLFSDYVPPHKNLESLFVRAYYEIMGG